MSFHCPNDTEK
jgi:hypothetical protein